MANVANKLALPSFITNFHIDCHGPDENTSDYIVDTLSHWLQSEAK